MIKLDTTTLSRNLTVQLTQPPFPGFNPKDEAERRGFSRPLPSPPHP